MKTWIMLALVGIVSLAQPSRAADRGLKAGVAKVDITHPDSKHQTEPLFVKALVLSDGETTAVLVTVDAVALEEIGPIPKTYLPKVRARLETDLKIKPHQVVINTSHCHAIVCNDVDERTVKAVTQAYQAMVPVKLGSGSGREDRISQNRRLKLKDGRTTDVRHAYAVQRDEDVASVGPIDPEIGVLKLDRLDGRPLAVLYQFACHPIQGHNGSQNTSDYVGIGSKVIEENLGEGAIALFFQGCGGDINPVVYKNVNGLRDAEPIGQRLGLSTLQAIRKIKTEATPTLKLINESLRLPRANIPPRIAQLESEQLRLLDAMTGTSLNFKTFLPLYLKYQTNPEFPSAESHAYLHEQMINRDDWAKLDTANRENLKQYLANIAVMEELTRLRTNLALLKLHLKQTEAARSNTLDVEVVGLRVGDFRLITFPGELTVQIGLNLKKASPHRQTFISGYTNGYIYYTPTAKQLRNSGYAQEDCDTLVAPEWQAIFETRAIEILRRL
jgi:hypothetical protein